MRTKKGYQYLFGKRLVPVSQVDYDTGRLFSLVVEVATLTSLKYVTAIILLEIMPSGWGLNGRCYPLKQYRYRYGQAWQNNFHSGECGTQALQKF